MYGTYHKNIDISYNTVRIKLSNVLSSNIVEIYIESLMKVIKDNDIDLNEHIYHIEENAYYVFFYIDSGRIDILK